MLPFENSLDNSAAFEQSLNAFSSSSVRKSVRKKRRKPSVGVFLRMIALCLCLGVLAFSLSKIAERTEEMSAAKRVYGSMLNVNESAIPKLKPARTVSLSKDLLAFLGSDSRQIEMLDTETVNYYDLLRAEVLATQKLYPDCIGYIAVSDTQIKYPVFKTDDNDYYLHHLADGSNNDTGAIFADYRLDDDYDKNMNTVIYGHCMKNGTMFRGIKLFFDSKDKYEKAKELTITFVTTEAVYIYEYFSGYRSEGSYFISTFNLGDNSARYYTFLRNIRARNTIPKDVAYNSNSKIITLITCTNVFAKPNERYVLHGILDEYFQF